MYISLIGPTVFENKQFEPLLLLMPNPKIYEILYLTMNIHNYCTGHVLGIPLFPSGSVLNRLVLFNVLDVETKPPSYYS